MGIAGIYHLLVKEFKRIGLTWTLLLLLSSVGSIVQPLLQNTGYQFEGICSSNDESYVHFTNYQYDKFAELCGLQSLEYNTTTGFVEYNLVGVIEYNSDVIHSVSIQSVRFDEVTWYVNQSIAFTVPWLYKFDTSESVIGGLNNLQPFKIETGWHNLTDFFIKKNTTYISAVLQIDYFGTNAYTEDNQFGNNSISQRVFDIFLSRDVYETQSTPTIDKLDVIEYEDQFFFDVENGIESFLRYYSRPDYRFGFILVLILAVVGIYERRNSMIKDEKEKADRDAEIARIKINQIQQENMMKTLQNEIEELRKPSDDFNID